MLPPKLDAVQRQARGNQVQSWKSISARFGNPQFLLRDDGTDLDVVSPSTGAAAHCAVLLMLGLAGHRPGTAQSAAGARPRCSFLQQRWQVHCGHGCFHMLRGMELDRWWQRGAHGDAGHILARWARQAGHSCSSTTLHCNFARTIPSWRHPDPPLQGPEPTPKGNPSPRLILNLGGCHG